MNPSWAVVLGASSGVGRAIARQVATAPGYSVWFAHRGHYAGQAAALISEIRDGGHEAIEHIGDVGTIEGVSHGAEALVASVPPHSVRLFVHSLANASVGNFLSGGDGIHRALRGENFHKTFDSMAHSFAWWVQALDERDLLAPEARLLGLTNPIGESIVKNFALITAAKAALEVYVKHLALELGPLGHRVNLLNFGTVETRAAAYGFGDKWERFKRVCERATPAGRMLTEAEVARIVTVLCGEAGAWFNGATIDFTGGQARSLLDSIIHDDELLEDSDER